ncbi:MAG: hypothetical protein N2C14_23350 [Planctomycetales bacterium]
MKVVVVAGEAGLFSGARARGELQFVKRLAPNRQSVAAAYNLPRAALEEDPSAAGEWRTALVDLKGPLTPERLNQAQLQLERARDRDKYFFCLWIDSAGGAAADS